MKRIVSILLICVLMLGMVSCKANKEEIHVIWSDLSDPYLATIADAVDRAMYIKNIRYSHVDSKGSAETQLSQVDSALATGAGVVVVSAVDAETSSVIVERARAKDAYVVFLCCEVAETVAMSYEKCVVVDVDFDSLGETLGTKIVADMLGDKYFKKGTVDSDAYAAFDRNGDGEITYLILGDETKFTACIEYINGELGKADRVPMKAHEANGSELALSELLSQYNDAAGATPELLLVSDDDLVESALLELRAKDFNYTMLKTHFIPFYTIGIAAAAGNLIPDKDEEERAAYSVLNTIDNGYVSAAALEDDDALAIALCTVLSNIVKEKDLFAKVDYVSGRNISVPYTIYG